MLFENIKDLSYFFCSWVVASLEEGFMITKKLSAKKKSSQQKKKGRNKRETHAAKKKKLSAKQKIS